MTVSTSDEYEVVLYLYDKGGVDRYERIRDEFGDDVDKTLGDLMTKGYVDTITGTSEIMLVDKW